MRSCGDAGEEHGKEEEEEEEEIERSYHLQGRELADLLDRAGRSLLESNTVNLFIERVSKSVFRPKCLQKKELGRERKK